ncbi:GNAT family N-acetyltransferase [Virgibacillus phasianinus]|uniref:GNAT family N-acetyltransferase n=1 Tax=Virgibacillus phasianinus TaxID=2017483 RepID=A0A220U7J7_9BACI|nr:GNAT family N-acetyltransferase [Virgibacillus phasianinus]ASK63866.1 GNAT family N-acetyltransferase [Virgibacillus phasianinus]
MIDIRRASAEHVAGISKVCSEGCIDTYKGIRSHENIIRNNQTFYNHDRICRELTETEGWDGYVVALENGVVVGAIGGGMTDLHKSEIYVLYLDPNRRGEGIGTQLLCYLTNIQIQKGSNEQWVSVQKGNDKGIPFYEARGFTKDSAKLAYSNVPGEDYVSLRMVREI